MMNIRDDKNINRSIWLSGDVSQINQYTGFDESIDGLLLKSDLLDTRVDDIQALFNVFSENYPSSGSTNNYVCLDCSSLQPKDEDKAKKEIIEFCTAVDHPNLMLSIVATNNWIQFGQV